MKNKFTSRLCVFMCFILILSTFAACSIKKDNDTTTTAPVIPNNEWVPGIDTYVPVTITDVELVQLVSEALGDEASGFNGDLNTLTPEQLEKVEDLANDKGLVVEKDENNNTVIKKEDVPATNITPEQKEIVRRTVVDNVIEMMQRVEKLNGALVIITIEPGFSVCPKDKDQILFRQILGAVNQRIANTASEVYMSASGIQFKIK